MSDLPANLQEFAARYTAAWCSHKAEAVAAFFAADGSLSINNGTSSVGRVAITAAAQSFMTAFPDLQVTMDNLLAQPDAIEYHWTLTGTNTGPGGTGRRVSISGCERWQLGSDGLILESQGHFDIADYNRQLTGPI